MERHSRLGGMTKGSGCTERRRPILLVPSAPSSTYWGLPSQHSQSQQKSLMTNYQRGMSKEIMEFGTTSPMFTILTTLAMVNLVCLVGAIKRVIMDDGAEVLDHWSCSLLNVGYGF